MKYMAKTTPMLEIYGENYADTGNIWRKLRRYLKYLAKATPILEIYSENYADT
jgi:hypothetical protein